MKISRLFKYLLLFLPLLAGCDLFRQMSHQPPERTEGADRRHSDKYTVCVSQFVFHSDVKIQREQALFQDLSNHREHVYRELHLPPSTKEVAVYLFEDKKSYDKFINAKYPGLPDRRAYFVAQPRRFDGVEDLVIYTYMGDRIQQDLRHELTHAMLHCVLKSVPIWLDEGLAEYFEVPAGQAGLNAKHLEALRSPNVRFDLARLETLEKVHQMEPAEYHESWAWVHLMLRSTPQAKKALLDYLQDLRGNAEPGPLRPRLEPAFLSLNEALRTHLTEIDRNAAQCHRQAMTPL